MATPDSSLVIRKVETRADYRVFLEFPWTLYRGDPNWVPPLLSMRRETFDRQRGAAWEYMNGEYFIAWRGTRPVGTIAAYINNRHNEYHGEHIGWFGAFEVENDREAAVALLNTAADWVRDQGYRAIRGPQTFTTHEECGLLIDGFAPPMLLYPYNKPYYAELVEAAGFHKVMDTHSFFIDAATARERMEGRLRRVTDNLIKRGKMTLRPVDRRNLKAEFALFKELYNAAWETNWGFVPMTARELDDMVASLGQFFDPRLAYFGYIGSELAGFIIAVPDFNQVLARARPHPRVPEFITLLRALYFWKIKPVITRVRVPLMGVKKEYRERGLDVAMYFTALEAILDAGYTGGDGGWILETNQPMMSVIQNIGMERYRTYRFYEKSL
ncbi:MAG: hypothetical protein ACUVS2_01630 [Candidatus Flexifilum sp.]